MVFKSCLFVIYFPTYDLAAAYLDGQYQASLIKTNKRLICVCWTDSQSQLQQRQNEAAFKHDSRTQSCCGLNPSAPLPILTNTFNYWEILPRVSVSQTVYCLLWAHSP